MKNVQIQLPEEVGAYIHQLSYECEGLKVLHTHALKSGISSEKVEKIRELYLEHYMELEEAKNEMWATYRDDHPHARKWEVDFSTYTLNIEEDDE